MEAKRPKQLSPLAADLLKGCRQIAEYIGESETNAYTWLREGCCRCFDAAPTILARKSEIATSAPRRSRSCSWFCDRCAFIDLSPPR